MKCIITDENDKFNYKTFVDQFHNPAEEIGFNFALLLTNLNEHMSNESRLNKFLDIGSEMLDYFKDRIETRKNNEMKHKVVAYDFFDKILNNFRAVTFNFPVPAKIS